MMFRGSEIARRYGEMCKHFMVGWVNCSRAFDNNEDLPDSSVAEWFAQKFDEALMEYERETIAKLAAMEKES